MLYYVHEALINNKAVVHTADCKYCNNGMGMKPDRNPKNHSWSGPYPTLAEAWQAARGTQHQYARKCGHCLPRIARMKQP